MVDVHSDILVSFPTPMEEPKNDLACTYLGCVYVERPGGMEILRPAVEKVSQTVPEDKWLAVTLNISPSSFVVCSDNVRRPLARQLNPSTSHV